ncbi:MAG: hypothetical protein ACRETC_01465 [Gammaproteobacteria bacterium]
MKQFEKAQRYLERIRRIYAGIPFDENTKKDYEDDVYSFFINCHHIRDWIISLNKVGIKASDVEAFIDNNQALQVCADLCDGAKHCKRNRPPRSNWQPNVALKMYSETIYNTDLDRKSVAKARYTVISAYGQWDVLDLGETCMKLWSEYVESMRKRAEKQGLDSRV